MIWWVLIAALVALFAAARSPRVWRALTGPARRALPASDEGSPLQQRLAGLRAAIEAALEALQVMSPELAQGCARTAMSRRVMRRTGSTVSETGPGTEVFEWLLRRVDEVSEQDRLDLADAGVDLNRVVETMHRSTPPPVWTEELAGTLRFVRDALTQARERGYR